MVKIYYLIPDLQRKLPFSIKALFRHILKGGASLYIYKCIFQVQKPIGGVKVIYQHCMLLRELGFNAVPVLMGNYHGNFFDFDIPTVKYHDVINQIDSEDIVVATEFRPYEGLIFKSARKILFLQNWMGLTKWLRVEDKRKDYLQLGYENVITCSKFCSEYIFTHMKISASTITNGIDLKLFVPMSEKRVTNRILAMSRKNPEDLRKIRKLLVGHDYEIKVVDGLTQNQLINEYQSADIFIATGYPEGFSLPPLEAMACGCLVVGFTGGAGREFMINDETALVAEDGDCHAVADILIRLMSENDKKEKIRIKGIDKAKEYGLENTKSELESFYTKLLKPIK